MSQSMAVKSSTPAHILTGLKEAPHKRIRVVPMSPPNGIPSLPKRFAQVKADLVSSSETAIAESWGRLLTQLRQEVAAIAEATSPVIPTIDFQDLDAPTRRDAFLEGLKIRGSAVVRNVVPENEALAMKRDLDTYLADNPHSRSSSPNDSQLYELYWSLAQLKARAHPNMLKAQTFVMSSCWHHSTLAAGSSGGDSRDGPVDSRTRITTNFPVAYADRVLLFHRSSSAQETPKIEPRLPLKAHVDGGSVERWEADGYGGRSPKGTYREIFTGHWEDWDPWDSSSRLNATSDLYNGANTCSVFRMFQGILSLGTGDRNQDSSSSSSPPMAICALPVRLVTAYWLLRPFFAPKKPWVGKGQRAADFLDPSNWELTPSQSPILHGAQPCHSQELNALLHPHLLLDRTLVPVPPLRPGDYVLFHPDVAYSMSPSLPVPMCTPAQTPPPTPQHSTGSSPIFSRSPSPSSPSWSSSPATPSSTTTPSSSPTAAATTLLYIPACPLTQTNALFLARQRKAFLLGFPGPDFAGGGGPGGGGGESFHMGRPGVQEVNEAGGEAALRATGLLAWDEDDATGGEAERLVLAAANGILFPDSFEVR
ncbi:hypothetical protein KVR01_010427 [Diaporthe batatas]|uniref:uncharacterized protein n=1 Tax=Diaporthe batatas TaxID=748121 RepID=UPI001D0546F5|nr:uncharacterized protein KVR01_010427 [Diaporthe batatas]KAG8159790.1 hypothetical protein KVR01_010427 [Diaporthe batatas]